MVETPVIWTAAAVSVVAVPAALWSLWEAAADWVQASQLSRNGRKVWAQMMFRHELARSTFTLVFVGLVAMGLTTDIGPPVGVFGWSVRIGLVATFVASALDSALTVRDRRTLNRMFGPQDEEDGVGA